MTIQIAAHHISFPVKDLTRSCVFYEDVLGLSTIPRPAMGSLKGVWYAAGPCEVHLIQIPEGADVGDPPPSLNPIARHAAFAVADYAETISHLKGFDLEVFESKAAGQAWVRDPDGHIIEFIVVT